MKITKFLSFFTSSFLIFNFYGCKFNKAENKRQANVVIIMADDLGYGDISSYNQSHFQTPNIDNIAKEGVKCNDFYVVTPYCAPSRGTILTGQFPLRHKLIKNPTPDAGINDIGIQDESITLAEVLKDKGYKTSCIGKWHLGHKERYFPVNHGFDEYYGILYSNDMRPVQIIENMDTVEYPVDQRLLTKKYTKRAIDFIQKNENNPFFLHLCHAMPHKPLAASKEFYTPETKENLYEDVIKELDWSVGEVVKKLRELNILDNTILIFMSDNGPWYGGSTGGLKGMKATTWEGGIRVPFIIRYPEKFTGNTEIDVPCWSPDIYPTILSMIQSDVPENYILDGIDITDILKDEQKEHPPVFSMHNNEILSVRKGDYKLFIHKPRYGRLPDDWVDSRGPDGETILAPMEQAGPEDYPGILPEKPENEIQLFNLEDDPTESVDLSDEMPEVVESLKAEYEAFKKTF